MTNEKTYRVQGMHCASCASIIERTLKNTDGVVSVNVNYGTETANISFDENETTLQHLSKKIEPFGYTLVVDGNAPLSNSKVEKQIALQEMKTNVFSAIPIASITILVMIWDILGKYNLVPQMSVVFEEFFHHLIPLFATYILFGIGKPYLLGLYRFIRYRKANMDTLIGLGTVSAFVYSFAVFALEEVLRPFVNVSYQYFDITIVVITFVALGKYLEFLSKYKTGEAIEKLLNLQAKTALIQKNWEEIEVRIEDVLQGDVIVIKPGAKVPVDGVIVEGSSFVDESMITGESIPVQKNVGDKVVSGTLNTNGSFMFSATKVGSETVLAQIIHMVSEAQGSRAPVQALADKVSSVFVPTVLVIALGTLVAWLSIGTMYIGFAQALSFGIMSFVSVLIIACPCALGLATPTAIIVGIGKGAKEGILIKNAETLEKLHTVTTVVVDKTGTLTRGKPTLIDIQNFSNVQDDVFISLLASLEKKSEHPIAHAIVSYAQEKKISLLEVVSFESMQGKGLKGILAGAEYFIGNTAYMLDLGVPFDASKLDEFTSQGKTPLILATKEKVLGFVTVADEIKSESVEAIKNLHTLGIKVVMLTGDNEKTAQYIGKRVGIDEVVAHVSPREKYEKIKELQKQGHIVAMAGDGVNDAPALALADVGIAMGTGTDVAIESAGITLLGGDISKLVKAITLSKITMRGIKQNLFWAFVYNIVGIPLAMGVLYPISGWLLSPVFAGAAMALSSVSVVSNSLRLKKIQL